MPTQRPNKRRPAAGLTNGEAMAMLLSVLALVWCAAAVWLSAQLGGTGHGDPASWIADNDGADRWNAAAAGWLLLFALITLVVAATVGVLWWRWWRGREWTDALASDMSSPQDFKELTEKAVARDAQRLGCAHTGAGVPVGRAVLTGQNLYGTYEWSQVWIMGTRAGKTRSVAIPQVLSHRGPVVATENKRDMHNRICGPRSEMGRVWVNDPQQIAHRPASWWWNPMSFVTSVERAEQLVEIWAAARTTADMAGADPYFEPEGRALLANLVMAAALGGEYVTRFPDWLTGLRPRPGVPDPAEILRAHGYRAMATDVETNLDLNPDQKDGLFGTARSFVRFLRSPEFVPWMAPTGPDDARPQFDPNEFVRSEADTLLLLSKDGAGSARALTAALTAAVYAAGETYAERSGGRVPTPVLFELDEAANICRWPELPRLYSHAGSKGLILVVILQSAPQGEEAWGERQFRMMTSAANIFCAGRGINDDETLSRLGRLIGDRQIADRSLSLGTRGHRSTSHQNRDERIFTEADLRALPRGRAVLFASGARPVLLALRDFTDYPWAPLVAASEAHFGVPDVLAQADSEEANTHA